MILFISALFVIFLLQQCTSVNLIPSKYDGNPEYKYLNETKGSEHYNLNKLIFIIPVLLLIHLITTF